MPLSCVIVRIFDWATSSPVGSLRQVGAVRLEIRIFPSAERIPPMPDSSNPMSIDHAMPDSPSLRLARYLKEFVGLRGTTVRDVDKYEKVVWFGDMPQEADCISGAWLDDLDPEAPLLEVHKQEMVSPPEPPSQVSKWIDRVAIRKATLELPPLLQVIFEEDNEAELQEGESPPLVEVRLEDHPGIVTQYESYRPRWEAWSTECRRRMSIHKVYVDLFRLHTQLQKQGEILEVVLGVGLLDWHALLGKRVVSVRRHTVVANVSIAFDARNGVIRVLAPSEGTRLQIEDDMLEAELRPDRSHYSVVEAQLEDISDAIWDRHRMISAIKTWAGAVSPSSTFSDGLEAKRPSGNDPAVSFAPALILRKRPQTGMVRVYEQIIEKLDSDVADIPDGWTRLTDDSWDAEGADPSDPAEFDEEHVSGPYSPTDIYFPLPANREQRRIIEALAGNQGVLVQGPPGTGKSHTIANLVCHLLATGKRVLITAETGRALRVLKDKLPEEIKPLCVSLLGQGGGAFSELNSAVQGITNRQSSYSVGANQEMIAEVDRDLDGARRKLAAIDAEFRSLRQDETIHHSILDGAYTGTASKIADRVAQEKDELGWIPCVGEVEQHEIPSNTDAVTWLDLRRRHTDEEIAEAARRIPDSGFLPSPGEFAHFVDNEARARESTVDVESLREHSAFIPFCKMDSRVRTGLVDQLQAIEEQRLALDRVQSKWLHAALAEMAIGRSGSWLALIELTEEHLQNADQLLDRVGGCSVDFPSELNTRKLRTDVAAAADYLEASGKWKRLGLMTPKPLKGRTYLKELVSVDGELAASASLLRLVQDSLDLDRTIEDLDSAWKDAQLGDLPSDRRLLVASIRENLADLIFAVDFTESCEAAAEEFTEQVPPVPVPQWLAGEAQQWFEVVEAVRLELEVLMAARQIEESGAGLAGLRQIHDAHSVVGHLFASIEARNVTSYSKAFDQLQQAEQVREAYEERVLIEGRLEAAAPGLTDVISATLDDLEWHSRLSRWQEAWRWGSVNNWLEKRSDFEYQEGLIEKRVDADKRIGHLIAQSASLRAWAHFFARLTTREANALRSWREAVRAMGKGTGRSAKIARLRNEARREMDVCRDAIPVWIMPRYLVAEMLDPSPGRYDLVIVDEASQLGIESLFLFYISKKIIVVGDDQQISPAGVGIADAAVAGLQQHFLDDLPFQHALSPQSSLYANAKIRFNQNIVLREHFRCMPEIIQFSNDLCYASNGTPLDPLRAYAANRLAPLVIRHVPDGYREGSTQNAQNRPEAEALVAQLCACVEDDRYKGATMGVISLQGEAQARLIENMLHEALDPEVIEERRIICGDAYAFQGDERNIIFLSMVAAPGERRIGVLSNEAARQRFNVAVSRAEDQLWLFHTVDLDSLSTMCMRHNLLRYMLEPKRESTPEQTQQFDSEFERKVYQRITDKGFHVRSQVQVGDPTNHRYRIDLVVEGMQGRLAVECDGDKWHGPDRYESDMARQRDLERAGWKFARIRGGDFYRDPERAMEPIWKELHRLGILPGGIDAAIEAMAPPKPVTRSQRDEGSQESVLPGNESAPKSHVPDETPQVIGEFEETGSGDSGCELESLPDSGQELGQTSEASQVRTCEELPACPQPLLPITREKKRYIAFEGIAGPDPRIASTKEVELGLRKIIEAEGPMLAKRAFDIYLRGCEIRRMGGELKRAMNRALQLSIRQGHIASEDEAERDGLLHSVVRAMDVPQVLVRERGPRDFEQIPPSELQLVARRLSRDNGLAIGTDPHLRAVLREFDLLRLTRQVEKGLVDALKRSYPFVDMVMENESQD